MKRICCTKCKKWFLSHRLDIKVYRICKECENKLLCEGTYERGEPCVRRGEMG